MTQSVIICQLLTILHIKLCSVLYNYMKYFSVCIVTLKGGKCLLFLWVGLEVLNRMQNVVCIAISLKFDMDSVLKMKEYCLFGAK